MFVEVDQLVELYGADRDRVEVVPLGVDHAFFSPGDRGCARRVLGLFGDGPLLLFVGRIQPLKGAEVALEAFEILVKSIPSAQFVLVGGPSGPRGEAEVTALGAMVEALDLGGRVRLWHRAAPVALYVLQSGRLLSGAFAFGVVRPRRPRGRGVRHPGSGRGGRRLDDARPARADRLPGLERRRRGVRPVRRVHLCRPLATG